MPNIESTEKQIRAIKKDICDLGPMRPGALRKHQQKKDGEVYGEYWHVSYTHMGQGHTNYVSKWRLPDVRKEVKNYDRFRILVDKLVSLSIELSKLKAKRKSDVSK